MRKIGKTATCDDCGSTRRQLRKYAKKTYRCSNCNRQYTASAALSNIMWACDCDE